MKTNSVIICVIIFGILLLFAQPLAAQVGSKANPSASPKSSPKLTKPAAVHPKSSPHGAVKVNLSQEMIQRMMRNRPAGQSLSADEQLIKKDNRLPAGFNPRDFARAGLNHSIANMHKNRPYHPNAAEVQFFKTLRQNSQLNQDILPTWMRSHSSDSSVAAPLAPATHSSAQSKSTNQTSSQQSTQPVTTTTPTSSLNPMYQKVLEQHLQSRQSQIDSVRQSAQSTK